MKIKILALILISSVSIFAQRLEIRNVFIEDYPRIKAEVLAYDENGEEFRELSREPIVVTEDGEVKNTVFQNCETNQVKYSLIVVADISGSMNYALDRDDVVDPPNRRIDLLQRSLQTLVREMDPSRSEFSLHLFAGGHEVFIEFSQNRDSILTILNDDIQTGIVTDFNSAFLGFDTFNREKGIGAIPYTANAKWKPIILFFSDGEHNVPQIDDSQVRANEILQDALAAEAVVFSAQFGGSTPPSISSVVTGTGGQAYSSLETEQDVQQAFADIIEEVRRNPSALPPCEVDWITDCDQNEIVISGTVNGSTVSATTTYVVPDVLKPSLEIDNRNVEILNNGQRQITLTARNSDITLNGADFSAAGFNFVENINNVVLTQDVPQVFNFTHTDNASDCTPTDITFNSNACNGNEMSASSGFLFAQDVFIGGATPGQTSNSNEICFNNNFCRDVTITNVRIENRDAGLFTVNFPGNTNSPQGNTNSFDFTYTPQTPGNHSADLIITADGIDYLAEIRGSSSGLPEISNSGSTNADDVVCESTSEIVIEVSNPGPVPLSVSNIELDNTTDFTLTSPTNFQVAPNNSETVNVTVTFDPQTEGTKNANLTITSDADNEPSLVIPLTGRQLDLEYQASGATQQIDLGEICPGEIVSFDAVIESIGETNGIVTLDFSSFPQFTPVGGQDLDFTGGDASLTKSVEFTDQNQGAFSYDIPFFDDCGNQYGTFNVVGEIIESETEYDASIYDYGTNQQEVAISSDINVTSQFVLTLNNPNNRPLNNIAVTILNNDDNVFQLVANDPTAIANGDYTVTVQYTPIAFTNYSLELNITAEVGGVLCLDQDLIPLSAGTEIASAEYTFDTYEALIDQEFQIDVPVPTENNFFNVGIKTIDVEVAVNNNLLASTDGVPETVNGNQTVYNYTIDINNPNPLNFVALNPNDPNVNSSPIEFNFLGTNPAGLANVTLNPTTFNLLRAKANIDVNEFQELPGRTVVASISSSDFEGVDPEFHRAILGTLRFDASLLAPTGDTPEGEIVIINNDYYREIDFRLDLLGQSARSSSDITTGLTNTNLSFDLITMLGDQPSTELEVIDPRSEVGEITFENINLGTFSLDPTCVDENGNVIRFFDPFADPAGMTVEGNPSKTNSLVKINLIEDGVHELKLVDLNGNTIKVLLDENISHGDYEYSINTDDLQNGVYHLMLITPTQSFTEKIIISH